ncbi:GntR family transcriptional regulator [Microbispora bryophytorum]|uniref:GntR family transcriptional regulator n=1 Tax=Microbispora bryophytorum subsp. camponoti TaxID=1677852 RepID=A0ABR8LE39_9ACTN|nr:GntR family transcriptional regulator [Microbispora camponoti]MBD3147061.1 GntR family transcriptional regulator [Microbispora camponoti]
MDSDRPLWLRIVEHFRQQISTGELPPGARLPSRPEIMREFGVSDAVAKQAARVLVSEGLAVAKPGSGTYVRSKPQLQRLVRAWYRGNRSGSPFAAEMEAQGRRAAWDYTSRTAQAPTSIRERLGLGEPTGDLPDVLRTEYVFSADGQPVMLSTSWEPLEITRGTPIAMPEEGPHAGRGVAERMLVIGHPIDDWRETVGARLGTAEECAKLAHPQGSVMLTIERVYESRGRVAETADIVLPADLYLLEYSARMGAGE